MEYLYERGPIMRLLASDRSIAGLAKRQDRDERGVMIDYFTSDAWRYTASRATWHGYAR